MEKKKQNLSSSPSNKNTSIIKRSVLFVLNIFVYFYYGIIAIIKFLFNLITLSFLFKRKGDKLERQISKEAKALKKEQELFKKQEEKEKKLQQKEVKSEKVIKVKEETDAAKRKRIAKEKRIQERLQREESKIIARAEKQKVKEKRLIERIEKTERLKREKEEAIQKRKENAEKVKKARLEAKAKKKTEERLTFSEKLKRWYKNLSFVKYRENKAEMERQVLLINFDGEDAVRSDQKIYYKYVAKKLETGEVEKGVFPAFSKLDVHSFLLAEGYEVYEITPQKNYGRSFFSKHFKKKMKRSDLIFFLTQLSTFLKSGLPLLDSIKILEKQTKKKHQKNLFKSIAYELTMGENFSEALEKQGDSFPKLLVNMIKSAELSGNLPEILDDMSIYYEDMEKTRKQMKSAMTYPLVIFIFAIIVVIFIMIFVIPEFVGIYAEMETDLPGITVAVINISNFLQKNIVYVILVAMVVIILLNTLYKSVKVFKTMVQWIMMHTPIFGDIIIYNEVTMFTKTFGSLLNHNVFITESMEVLSKITNNEIYKMLIFDTITNLAKGSPISQAFKNQWAFPVIAYEMLLTGEKTGELGDMMVKVSNYYQLQHKNTVNQIKTFIEPVMIVILTVMVGIILLSVLLPMFSMYSGVLG